MTSWKRDEPTVLNTVLLSLYSVILQTRRRATELDRFAYNYNDAALQLRDYNGVVYTRYLALALVKTIPRNDRIVVARNKYRQRERVRGRDVGWVEEDRRKRERTRWREKKREIVCGLSIANNIIINNVL
jgi:hypothetical protein